MYNLQEITKGIYDAIIGRKRFFEHGSMLIVGNNSLGKTQLVKGLLNKAVKDNRKDFYYIDPQNRNVIESTDNLALVGYKDFTIEDILKSRMKKAFFTKKDIFDEHYSGGVVTFSELLSDLDKYNMLFGKFMDIHLSKKDSVDSMIGGSTTIRINDSYNIEELSNSESAKMRILMETDYANEMDCGVVIIDEFDSHFDSDNMIKFIGQLQEKYKRIRFIFVIHNAETLVNIQGMDVILFNNSYGTDMRNGTVLILDSDNITQLGEIHRIRSKYIGDVRESEWLLNQCVSDIVKKKTIRKESLDKFRKLDYQMLSTKEKIVYSYIEEVLSNEDKAANPF